MCDLLATSIKYNTTMDQHEWVRQCTEYYECVGLTPGDPNDGEWDVCHYPDPKGAGEQTIWLLREHHQPQGLWQSEEHGRQCFFSGDAKRFLVHSPFVPGWFDLWDLYDKWTSESGRKKIRVCHNHSNTLEKRPELAISMNKHPNTFRNRAELVKKNGHKSGRKNCQIMNSHPNTQKARPQTTRAMNSHPNTQKSRSETGKKSCSVMNAQKWRCLVTGYISSPGGLTSYQRVRGIDKSQRERVE